MKVLGTQFNVMNYSGEPTIQTTLLEGSVQFIAGNNEMLLAPGQQSNLDKNGSLSIAKNVDVELVTAWKNGLQSFRHA
ncbi:MAG TPA: FecR family protein, partial [Chitinophagaceae bacterium]|nr:FecR family protein [Chitinophagaceae bacterium]